MNLNWALLVALAVLSLASPPLESGSTISPKWDHSSYGLNLISSGINSSLDIIFVHGLDGHWRETWTFKESHGFMTASTEVFWLKELLPGMIPDADIYSYGYDSRTHSLFDQVNQDTISGLASNLLVDIVAHREATQALNRPVIFVMHSLGGLLVKNALIRSHLSKNYLRSSIARETKGLVFLGTPHQGGQGAYFGRFVARAVTPVMRTTRNVIRNLDQRSDWLQEQQRLFVEIADDFPITCFYETYRMPYTPDLVVPRHSAVIQNLRNVEEVALAAHHSNMVKYSSVDDPNFKKVALRLVKLAKNAIIVNDDDSGVENVIMDTRKRTRLRAEISRQRLSEFNVSKARIPFQRNPKFTGRTRTLSHLENILSPLSNRERMQTAVLHGTGGMGKTQIAIEFAHRKASEYSSMFWFDGSSNDAIERGLRNAVELLCAHYKTLGWTTDRSFNYDRLESSNDTSSRQEAFLNWLSDEENTDWLLIFDNVDDIELAEQIVRGFTPPTNFGRVLMTSRRSDLPSSFDFIGIEVNEMHEEEGMELLLQGSHLEREVFEKERRYAEEILEALGYLPLAISQAGAYISQHSMVVKPLRHYLQTYRRDATRLLQQYSFVLRGRRDGTVLMTWEISFSAIQRESSLAPGLLSMCAFLNDEYIQPSLFTERLRMDHKEVSTIEEAFKVLINYSLIKQRTSDTYTIHPLVHLWLRQRLTDTQRHHYIREAIQIVYRSHKSQSDQSSPDGVAYQLLPYLQALEKSSRQYLSTSSVHIPESAGPPPSGLLEEVIGDPWEKGYCILQYTRSILEDATDYIQERWTKDSGAARQPWRLLYELGQVYRDTGAYSSAEHLYRWTLAEAWSRYPVKHPRALEIAGDFAWMLAIRGKVDQAREWYQWVFDARECVFGKKNSATMGALMGLARCDALEGDFETAIQRLQEAFETRKSLLGPEDRLTLNAMDHLSDLELRLAEQHIEGGQFVSALNLLATTASRFPCHDLLAKIDRRIFRDILEAVLTIVENSPEDTEGLTESIDSVIILRSNTHRCPAGDDWFTANLIGLKGHYLLRQHRNKESLAQQREAYTRLREPRWDPYEQGKASFLTLISFNLNKLGQYDEALTGLMEAHELLIGINADERVLSTECNIISTYWLQSHHPATTKALVDGILYRDFLESPDVTAWMDQWLVFWYKQGINEDISFSQFLQLEAVRLDCGLACPAVDMLIVRRFESLLDFYSDGELPELWSPDYYFFSII